MKRLMEKIVFCGLVTAWRLATVPTRRSPDCAKATTDGVVRPPSEFSMTVGSPPSSTAMQEFVVPRSMPIVLPMWRGLLLRSLGNLRPSVVDLRPMPARRRRVADPSAPGGRIPHLAYPDGGICAVADRVRPYGPRGPPRTGGYRRTPRKGECIAVPDHGRRGLHRI